MNLKTQSDKAPILLPPSPAWGELADAGQTETVVAFECTDAVYTYPYHTLARWVLESGKTDILCVRAYEDEVTIRGRNLKAIGDALGSARLRVLRVTNVRYLDSKDTILVDRIDIERRQ